MMTVDDALKYAQNALERAFEDWLESERPSGDCESVHRQWDESFAHQELVDELQPVLALTWEVRRLRGLRDEVDQLRCQLAGCGVAALENTVDSRSLRAVRGDYGYSASYEDVCNAVDREIALREENERLRENAKIISELEQLAARSNNDLLVENERLRKDAERLDWISHQCLDDLCMTLVIDAPHDGEYYVHGDGNQKGYGHTLRDAIDAARSAK